jgi:hypothetical protein
MAGGGVDEGEVDEDAAASFTAARLPFFFVHRHKMNNNSIISWRLEKMTESKNVTQTRRSQPMKLLIPSRTSSSKFQIIKVPRQEHQANSLRTPLRVVRPCHRADRTGEKSYVQTSMPNFPYLFWVGHCSA